MKISGSAWIIDENLPLPGYQGVATMEAQTTSNVIMIRPAAFGFNAQTAENNTFQHQPDLNQGEIADRARAEFDALVQLLRNEGVNVTVFEDSVLPAKPDAVFPNNWVSFHADGTIVTYPMYAPLRRLERRKEILDEVRRLFEVGDRIELESYESDEKYLEGTGSMVLDRANKIAYACVSPRTDVGLLHSWCKEMGYEPFTFHARFDGQDIYHTNVMMAIGEGVAAVSLEVVAPASREALRSKLLQTGHEVVELRKDQIGSFAGNMLAVRNVRGEQLMVMSKSAFNSLDEEQKARIGQHARIIHSDVATIETIGGGSVRCMIAENFLSRI